MKVTVCFGELRVVVPCGSGEYLVKQLVTDAVARYHKALAKSSDDSWLININSLRLMVADGGILDPDDCVTDVVDDREQLTAILEEPLGHRHHNNGDGMSVGTSSPVSFHDDEASQTEAVGRHDKSRLVAHDVIVTAVENESTIDHSVVSGLQQAQLGDYMKYVRGRHSNNSSSQVVNANVNHMASIVDKDKVFDKQKTPDNNLHSIGKAPVISDATDPQGDVETIIIEFPKSSQPLGIHVIPELDEAGRNRGLVIQSLEPGGRAQLDARLHVGDLFTEINGTSLFQVDFNRAQEIFRRAMQDRRLQLTVIRRCDSESGSSTPAQSTNQHTALQPAANQHIAVQPSAYQHAELLSEAGSKHSATASIASSSKSSEDALSISESRGKKEAPPVALRSRSHSDDRNSRVINRKQTISLIKGNGGLGFTVTTRASPDPSRCFVYIKNIMPGGAAISDGRLKPGDLLLEINGQNMTDKTQNEAVELLRSTPLGGSVQLVICRQLVEKQSLASQNSSLQSRPTSTIGFQEMLTSPSKMIASQRTDMVANEEMTSEDSNEPETQSVDMLDHPSQPEVDIFDHQSQMAAEKHSVHSMTSSATSESRSSSIKSRSDTRSDVVQQLPITSSQVDNSEVSSDTSSGVLEVSGVIPTVKTDCKASATTDDLDPETTGAMFSSRKSLSMGNLSTLDRKQSMDSDVTVDDFQQGRLKFARKVNQSFRAAVDKSYDGPSLYAILTEAKFKDGQVDKKKSKKEDGKSGFKWLFGLSRRRSKSVNSKEKASESKRPEITLVLPPDGAAKSGPRLESQLPVSSKHVTDKSDSPLIVGTKLTSNSHLSPSFDSRTQWIQVPVSDENNLRGTPNTKNETAKEQQETRVPSSREVKDLNSSVRHYNELASPSQTRVAVGEDNIGQSESPRRYYVGDVLYTRPAVVGGVGDVLYTRPAVDGDQRSRPPYRQPLEDSPGFERQPSRSGQLVATKQVKPSGTERLQASPHVNDQRIIRSGADLRDTEIQQIIQAGIDPRRPPLEDRPDTANSDYSRMQSASRQMQPRHQFSDRPNADLYQDNRSSYVIPAERGVELSPHGLIASHQDYDSYEANMRQRVSEPTSLVYRPPQRPTSQFVSYQQAPAAVAGDVGRQQYNGNHGVGDNWTRQMPTGHATQVVEQYPRYDMGGNKSLVHGQVPLARDDRQAVPYRQPPPSRFITEHLPRSPYTVGRSSPLNYSSQGLRSPVSIQDHPMPQSTYWSRDLTRDPVHRAPSEYPKPVYYEQPAVTENTSKQPVSGVNRTNAVVYGPPRLAQKSYQFWNLPEQTSNGVPGTSPLQGFRTYMA